MDGMHAFERGRDWVEGFTRHPGWMEWTMIVGAIALLIIAAALIALVVRAWVERPFGRSATQSPPLEEQTQPSPDKADRESARAVLDARYAAGEIDRDDYLARRADIEQ